MEICIEKRIKAARENHINGCNCAQAVLCAYADLYGLDDDMAYRVSEGFGRGNGDRSGMCGAVSGALMVTGLAFSNGKEGSPDKGRTYEVSAMIMKRFLEKNGTLICRELKGTETGKPLRSCMGCIEDAARIAGEILNE